MLDGSWASRSRNAIRCLPQSSARVAPAAVPSDSPARSRRRPSIRAASFWSVEAANSSRGEGDVEVAAHFEQQRRHQQRVAAEIHEVVVAADARDVDGEDARPGFGQQPLGRRRRWDGSASVEPALHLRRRQRRPRDLAVRRERKRRENRTCGGTTRPGGARAGAPGSVGALIARLGHCRHECATSGRRRRVGPGGHRGVADAVQRSQRRLDLAQLDADAADLDLVVEPLQADDVAVRQEAGQVAGPVEPLAGSERVWR